MRGFISLSAVGMFERPYGPMGNPWGKIGMMQGLCKCYMAVNQIPVLSRAPPPLLHTPVSRPVATYLCRECLSQVCPTKEPSAKVLVASQEILFQTYVAESSPKPVTNPVF